MDIGVVGLGVMGQNIALNLLDKNFSVVVYNRTASKVEDFLKIEDPNCKGTTSLKDFCAALSSPRKILLMIKAGAAIDEFLKEITLFLAKGDIIIDGGNSHFLDTQRRKAHLNDLGIFYIGAGISGGEEGARRGPSIMPGGDSAAWPRVEHILKAIAAKTKQGSNCCEWIGGDGSGHFVKMVHNGIEYGIMQLIAETYDLLKKGKYSYIKMAELFAKWNSKELESYLIEISSKILQKRDVEGGFLVENILDVAGQKGTGKWTVESALNLGVSTPLFAEALFVRNLSAKKDERLEFSQNFVEQKIKQLPDDFARQLEESLYLSMVVSYSQGFDLLQAASLEFKWDLNLSKIAEIWQGGCIIRSALLEPISAAFKNHWNRSLLFYPFFIELIHSNIASLREIVKEGINMEVPLFAFSSALSYLDGLKSISLPINLLQAQRDFFGSHLYERKDRPRGEFFHTIW